MRATGEVVDPARTAGSDLVVVELLVATGGEGPAEVAPHAAVDHRLHLLGLPVQQQRPLQRPGDPLLARREQQAGALLQILLLVDHGVDEPAPHTHEAKQIGIELTYFPIADVHLIQFPEPIPENRSVANDDPTTGDEDNAPYVTYEKDLYGYNARKGAIASSDRPNSPSIAATAGTPGETDTESIKFETFVRLNVGLITDKAQWLVISEPHQWMVIQKFERGNDRMHADNCEFHADHNGF